MKLVSILKPLLFALDLDYISRWLHEYETTYCLKFIFSDNKQYWNLEGRVANKESKFKKLSYTFFFFFSWRELRSLSHMFQGTVTVGKNETIYHLQFRILWELFLIWNPLEYFFCKTAFNLWTKFLPLVSFYCLVSNIMSIFN